VKKQQWDLKHPKEDKHLRTGLNFHFGDVTETEDAEYFGAISDRFRLIVVLKGVSLLTIGDKQLTLGEDVNINIALVSLHHEESFSRKSIKDNYCQRISIGISEQWMNEAFKQHAVINQLPHLYMLGWKASKQLSEVARQMLFISSMNRQAHTLELEACALNLIIEAVNHFHKQPIFPSDDTVQTRTKSHKFSSLCDYIRSNVREKYRIEELAKRMNMTVSTLQRQFKQSQGLTVFEFIQKVKLTQAYLMIQSSDKSITSIAGDFGYDSPASFTSAFKRFYRCTPSQVRSNSTR